MVKTNSNIFVAMKFFSSWVELLTNDDRISPSIHFNVIIFSEHKSLITSVIIQIITGIIEIGSIFIKVPTQVLFLKQMMMLEIAVQFIEGFFYSYWLINFKGIPNITPQRYFDWMITTPTMLVNLIFYLIYLKNKDDTLDFVTLFKKEFNTILLFYY